jgi:hypothetical protein
MMTNYLKVADSLLHDEEYRILNVLGVVRSVTKSFCCLHTTFGGFGLFNLPIKQLICRVNMLMQHYHTSTNLSRKLDASLRYLQLQLGTPYNPLLLDYAAWGHLAPLLWVKMLWQTLHHFDIHLHMAYPNIAFPRERDQVIMEIFLSMDLSLNSIQSLGQCRVVLEAMFLSDLTTTNGKFPSEISSLHQVAGTRHQYSSFLVSSRLGATGIHGSIYGITLPSPGIHSRFH